MQPNPFIPGTPALGKYFINRTEEQIDIYGRLATGCSVAIIGNPHIGKTSLLKKLKENKGTKKFGLSSKNNIIVSVDFGTILTSHTVLDFWKHICSEVIDRNLSLSTDFEQIGRLKKFDADRVEKAFSKLSHNNIRVIVLIDEFDKFFDRPHFLSADFIDPLRTISMNSGGLSIVTASRLSVSEMQQKILKLKITSEGSPFNFLQEIHLGTFEEETINGWLLPLLSPDGCSEVRLLAGRHPYLLHLAGRIQWNEEQKKIPIQWALIRRMFFDDVDAHFEDTWAYLGGRAQLITLLLLLRESNGQLHGVNFNISNVEKSIKWYSKELNSLHRRAILSYSPKDGYKFESPGFRTWLIQNKLPEKHEALGDISSWLRDKEFKLGGLVTNEEINYIKYFLQSIPTSLLEVSKKFLTKE